MGNRSEADREEVLVRSLEREGAAEPRDTPRARRYRPSRSERGASTQDRHSWTWLTESRRQLRMPEGADREICVQQDGSSTGASVGSELVVLAAALRASEWSCEVNVSLFW